MYRLLVDYYRYIIGKTGAVADKLSIFDFNRLKKVVELYIMAAEDIERIAILFRGNV